MNNGESIRGLPIQIGSSIDCSSPVPAKMSDNASVPGTNLRA